MDPAASVCQGVRLLSAYFIILIYEGAINLKHFSTLQKQNRSTIGLRATVFVIYDRFAFAAR